MVSNESLSDRGLLALAGPERGLHRDVRLRVDERTREGTTPGAEVGLEFTGVTPGCTSLESAANLIRLASRPNAGFGVDCLHLVRTGGTPTDVAAMPAELFGYFQICDGPDLVVRSDCSAESRERMVPGEGVFPIAEILDALPAATPVDVEVPSIIGSQRGVPALERARRSVSAARELLDRAQPTR